MWVCGSDQGCVGRRWSREAGSIPAPHWPFAPPPPRHIHNEEAVTRVAPPHPCALQIGKSAAAGPALPPSPPPPMPRPPPLPPGRALDPGAGDGVGQNSTSPVSLSQAPADYRAIIKGLQVGAWGGRVGGAPMVVAARRYGMSGNMKVYGSVHYGSSACIAVYYIVCVSSISSSPSSGSGPTAALRPPPPPVLPFLPQTRCPSMTTTPTPTPTPVSPRAMPPLHISPPPTSTDDQHRADLPQRCHGAAAGGFPATGHGARPGVWGGWVGGVVVLFGRPQMRGVGCAGWGRGCCFGWPACLP